MPQEQASTTCRNISAESSWSTMGLTTVAAPIVAPEAESTHDARRETSS
jgi:hypothetical protein